MGFAHKGNPGPKITHTKFKKYCTERKVWRRANFSLEVSGHTAKSLSSSIAASGLSTHTAEILVVPVTPPAFPIS